MPRRVIPFENGEIYHVFNRSVGIEQIFNSYNYLYKILEVVRFYRYPQSIRLSRYNRLPSFLQEEYMRRSVISKPIIELFAYSFMPNHYHFLIKQLRDNGIVTFIRLLQNSYAKYYNTKMERHGSLFQTQFKAKRIENDEQFLHTSRYMHLNHVTAYLFDPAQLLVSPWTSFRYYCGSLPDDLVNTAPILSFFPGLDAYREFVFDQVDYQRTLAGLKKTILD